MLGGVFASLGMKIASGLAVGAFLALGVQTWRLSSAHAEIEAQRNLVAAERANHAVTRGSVDRLEGVVATLMETARQRQEQYLAAKAAAAKADKRLNELARTSDARIARLNELARQGGSCPASPELLRELEGL